MSDHDAAEVWTVSRLTREIRQLLVVPLSRLWVEGEVSNLVRSGAGHCYFTLKDDRAQIRAVLWASDAEELAFDLVDGLHVIAAGSVDVYVQRGVYQLVVRSLTPKGIGPLELAFRQLCERLSKEGLFEAARKRPIPRLPRRVALITSASGAAVHDFLQVALRRWPAAQILLVPSLVQGDEAPAHLIAALGLAQQLPVDVIALVRGGGSIEDLWAFNDERLARAIFASTIPVVSGVGHEIDVTIADLVADLRALTPSEAAERIFPDMQGVKSLVEQQTRRLALAMQQRIIAWENSWQRCAQLRCFRSPQQLFDEAQLRWDEAERRLAQAAANRLEQSQRQWIPLLHRLETLNPLAVLRRGFSLASDAQGGVIAMAGQLEAGEHLWLRFVDGKAYCEVERIDVDNK